MRGRGDAWEARVEGGREGGRKWRKTRITNKITKMKKTADSPRSQLSTEHELALKRFDYSYQCSLCIR